MPATTGGSTSGTVTSARSSPRPAELHPGQQPGQRQPEHQADQHRRGRGDDREPERLARRLGAQLVEQAAAGRWRPTIATSGTSSTQRRPAPAGTRSRTGGRPSGSRLTARANPASVSAAWPSSEVHQVDPLLGEVGVLASAPARSTKYDVSCSSAPGISIVGDVVARGHRVGGVDQPGVGLAGDDLVERGPDVLLEAGRLGGDAVVLQHAEGDPAAGHLVGAAHPGGAVEVGERLDAGRVVGRGDDHQHVGGERRRPRRSRRRPRRPASRSRRRWPARRPGRRRRPARRGRCWTRRRTSTSTSWSLLERRRRAPRRRRSARRRRAR